MQDTGLLWSFLSPGTSAIWYNEARGHPLSLSSIQSDGYCLFMDTAGSLRMRVIMNCAHALRDSPAGHILFIYSCPSVRWQQHKPTVCELKKNLPNVNPSVFTHRACPCGVVSNMAPDRPARFTLALSGFHYQGLLQGGSNSAGNEWQY